MKSKAVKVFIVTLIVSVGWLAGAAWADNYPLRHNCRQPNEPWGKPDRRAVESYHDDADKYE